MFIKHAFTTGRNEYSFSTILVLGHLGLLSYVIAAHSGFYGLLFLLILPRLVSSIVFSLLTLVQHTSPTMRFVSEGEFTHERMSFAGTLHIDAPFWFDWFSHDALWHIPHTLFPRIPFYHLRKAYHAIRKVYPEFVQEAPFSFNTLYKCTSSCHLVKGTTPEKLQWISFRELEKKLEPAV